LWLEPATSTYLRVVIGGLLFARNAGDARGNSTGRAKLQIDRFPRFYAKGAGGYDAAMRPRTGGRRPNDPESLAPVPRGEVTPGE
jgi:hypothetical protein